MFQRGTLIIVPFRRVIDIRSKSTGISSALSVLTAVFSVNGSCSLPHARNTNKVQSTIFHSRVHDTPAITSGEAVSATCPNAHFDHESDVNCNSSATARLEGADEPPFSTFDTVYTRRTKYPSRLSLNLIRTIS